MSHVAVRENSYLPYDKQTPFLFSVELRPQLQHVGNYIDKVTGTDQGNSNIVKPYHPFRQLECKTSFFDTLLCGINFSFLTEP